jgi:hypothetical protein
MRGVSTRRHRTAVELDYALRLLGYEAGYPIALSEAGRRADEEDAANHCCPACGCRGLVLSPYCRGVREYEVVLVCNECGTAAVLV